ncbi:MAG: hypothetical protein SFU98_21100 [Leptospiraceae bacterium]|nr:hypothetical protein [Leptospiraceae bacterium]
MEVSRTLHQPNLSLDQGSVLFFPFPIEVDFMNPINKEYKYSGDILSNKPVKLELPSS